MRTLFIAAALLCSPIAARAEAPANANDEKLKAAQEKFTAKDYQAAHDMAQAVIATDAANARAWRLSGSASCFLKDADGAKTALGHLTADSEKKFVRYLCEKSGIKLP